MSTETNTLDRNDILREIAECEARIDELRALLPTCIKTFFRFRCRPEKYVWVYAENREQAEQRLHARMHKTYGNTEAWQVVSKVVDQYDDPQNAAVQSHGNLLTYVTEAEAREFVNDYRANERGKTPDPNRPKHLPLSQLEKDVSDWEHLQRRKGNL
ncbi:hypothetical protein [Bremerella alba]|uniref:Uncharacterized protein n=1 Tax=Bremerella alba TaxID=980252 RepID=A0A7V8V2D5_9BACT|nr:hypothetical protein [Bremerella alba]MBA2113667.1 hypothetical protein [Bremerella alba]